MPDLSEGVDGLREDMALHQRRFSGEVTDAKNHTLAAEAIARLERETAETKPAPVQAEALPDLERREVNGRGYTVQREAVDSTKIRKASPEEHRFMVHALPRIEMLLTKMDRGPLGQPSWHERTMAVLELKSRVAGLRQIRRPDLAAEMDLRFMFEMLELLNDSNRLFGDWEADPGTRITVAV